MLETSPIILFLYSPRMNLLFYSILLFPKNEPIILIGDVSSIIYLGLFTAASPFLGQTTLSMQVMFGILIYKRQTAH